VCLSVAQWNAQVRSQLDRLHVDVLSEQRAIIPDDVKEKLNQGDLLYLEEKRTFRTSAGKDIAADLTFFTTGTRLNSGALSSGPFASILTTRGELPVNDQLQVRGYSNIFAIGDISGRESGKLAKRAGDQAKYLGKHLPQVHQQRGDVTGIPAYAPAPHGLFISLGRKGGAGELAGSVFPVFLVKMIKSGDMLVGKFRGDLGLKKTAPDARLDLTPQEVQEKAVRLAKACKISENDAQRLVKGQLVEPTVRLPAGQDHL
jgi:NADH dehydrogenase FAD-containing subunit